MNDYNFIDLLNNIIDSADIQYQTLNPRKEDAIDVEFEETYLDEEQDD